MCEVTIIVADTGAPVGAFSNINNVEAALNQYTYEAASVATSAGGTVALSNGQSKALGFVSSGSEPTADKPLIKSALKNGKTVSIVKPFSGSITVSFPMAGSDIYNVTHSKAYTFEGVENGSFTPPALNKKAKYNNNISHKGEFLGRTVISESSSMDLKFITFKATKSRLEEVQELFDKLQENAFYIHFKVDGMDYVHYGWTDGDPEIEYNGDETEMQITLKMRVYA